MKIRPSTQIQTEGGTAGQGMVVDPTGAFWQPGTPTAGPSTYTETNLGTSSLDTAGSVVLTYTPVYGIDGTGTPYYDPAGPVAGEEAVMVIGTDGSINLVQPGV